MLNIINLIREFENNTGEGSIRILNKLNIDFNYKEIICLAGANGAGKTTFFDTLLNPFAKYEGEILFLKNSIRKKNIHNLFLSQCVYLAHEPGLFYDSSVYENLFFFYRISNLKKINKVKLKEKIDYYLNFANLYNFRNQKVRCLSRGQKQKLALVRCFQNDAKIFLLDEPLNALDLQGFDFFIKLLVEAKNKNSFFLISSHNIEFFKNNNLADRYILLESGKFINQ